jgi:hypothetical protein
VGLIALWLVGCSGDDKGTGDTGEADADSDADTDTDADTDSDTDADADTDTDTDSDTGPVGVAGHWTGPCVASGTAGTTAIDSITLDFELTESAGIVDGGGTFRIDLATSTTTTTLPIQAILATGTWDGTTLSLGFAYDYGTSTYPAPSTFEATIVGDVMTGELVQYTTISWPCTLDRL